MSSPSVPSSTLFARGRLLPMTDGGDTSANSDGSVDSIAAVDGRIAAIGSEAELRRRFPIVRDRIVTEQSEQAQVIHWCGQKPPAS